MTDRRSFLRAGAAIAAGASALAVADTMAAESSTVPADVAVRTDGWIVSGDPLTNQLSILVDGYALHDCVAVHRGRREVVVCPTHHDAKVAESYRARGIGVRPLAGIVGLVVALDASIWVGMDPPRDKGVIQWAFDGGFVTPAGDAVAIRHRVLDERDIPQPVPTIERIVEEVRILPCANCGHGEPGSHDAIEQADLKALEQVKDDGRTHQYVQQAGPKLRG